MTDNLDIRSAADQLQNALKSLESALVPLVGKVEHLETALREAESLQADRAEMAQRLDTAKAREAEFAAREAEFNRLADETMGELNRTIRQVKKTLDRGDS